MKNLNEINVRQIFGTRDSDGVLTYLTLNNSNQFSDIIDLRGSVNLGYHSLGVLIDGAGSHASARLDLDYWLSFDGVYWTRSTDGYNILTDYHEDIVTDTGETDGIDIVTFNPALAAFIKFKATETATQAMKFCAWYLNQ